MATDDLVLRDLASEADYEACIDLQRATWGNDFRELVGPALLKVTQKVGGIAAGAFDRRDSLVAFVYGITGLSGGTPVHWSHMLAVQGSLRDRGLGRRLKLYQRDRVRALGVRRMLWTFDPLVARNAHLNLNRLGTRVVEYAPDMYGTSMLSRTDSVIGSDRFVVEWDLDAGAVGREAVSWPDAPVIGTDSRDLPAGPSVVIEIPGDIQTLKQERPDEARSWRDTSRRAFQHYLGAGYRVAALARTPDARRVGYLLTASHV